MFAEVLERFLRSAVEALSNDPERVRIEIMPGERVTIMELSGSRDEMALLIGKRGRTVEALRVLVRCVVAKYRRAVLLAVVDANE